MKKLQKISLWLIAVIIAAFVLNSCSPSSNITLSVTPHSTFTSADAVKKPYDLTEEVRGVWVASVYNINFPSTPDLNADKLKAELEDIVENVLSHNMNTIYFQVHPASDALYKSDMFPVSEYLFTDGVLHFDPLDYMVKLCKENNISLYAWVNPLRISVSASDYEEEARNALPNGSPGKDSELTVFYGDGKLYLNCGVEAVRNLVADAVEEIVTFYDVDGIVFDDYFYPYPVSDDSGQVYKFNDEETYSNSKSSLSLDDWRRDNVNQMIKLCYSRIKSHDPDVQFGVAPFGIWQNNNGQNGGSDTSGMEAYSELYCDAVAWIKGKYVDFISPQLYWECDSEAAPFGELVSFWSKVADGTGVDVVVSHGVYQYETWDQPEGELNRQIEIAREYISYKGSILYGYEALVNNSAGLSDDALSAFNDSIYYYHSAEYPKGIMMSVNDNIAINDNTITFDGYSNPNLPLTVNDQPVTRSHGGYFKCELMLSQGENGFVFVCGDDTKTITVIKN